MRNTVAIEIRASTGFQREYRNAYIDLQRQVQHAIRDVLLRWASLGPAAVREYDRFASLEDAAQAVGYGAILEVDVGGGPRLLIGVHGRTVDLVALANHDDAMAWQRIPKKRAWLRDRMNSAQVSRDFGDSRHGLFLSLAPAAGWAPYFPGEENEAWWHFLDIAQSNAIDQISGAAEEQLIGGSGHTTHLVLGGPGTGKTIVLVKLLQHLLDEGFTAGLLCSDELHQFLSRASRSCIPRAGIESDVDVLLVDDPASLATAHRTIRRRQAAVGPSATIFAFDPLQLDTLPSHEEIELLSKLSAQPAIVLRNCYRQREALASRVVAMTDVLARSSPYGRADRVEEFESRYSTLLQMFNDMDLVYPQGDFSVLDADNGSIERHLERVIGDPFRWRHAPSLLIVFDTDAYTELSTNVANELPEDIGWVIQSNDVERIKGLDFQHAVIVLSQATFDSLNAPFIKSGEREFHRRRLFRIAVSRARDSLALVVVPSALS